MTKENGNKTEEQLIETEVIAEVAPESATKAFFKKRWVKITGAVVAGLLILGLGIGIGEEIFEDRYEGNSQDKEHSVVENKGKDSKETKKSETETKEQQSGAGKN